MRTVVKAVAPVLVLAALVISVIMLIHRPTAPPQGPGPKRRPPQQRASLDKGGREKSRPTSPARDSRPHSEPTGTDADLGTLIHYLDGLKGRVVFYAIVPDGKRLKEAALASKSLKLAEKLLQPGLFQDSKLREEVSAWRNRAGHIGSFLGQVPYSAVAYWNLPAKLSPALIVPTGNSGKARELLKSMFPESTLQSVEIGGGLSVTGEQDVCKAFPKVPANRETGKTLPLNALLILKAERSFISFLGAVLGGSTRSILAKYSLGVNEIRGVVRTSPTGGIRETWRVLLSPGRWPLHALGGPSIDLRPFGDLPATTIAAAAGFAEMVGILPEVEKTASRIAPGFKTSDLLSAGLDGPVFAGLASPTATWRPSWYVILEPKGKGAAVSAFERKYREFCSLAGLKQMETVVAGNRVRFASASGMKTVLKAALIPAWTTRGNRLLLGQGAAGIKEMLSAKTLSTNAGFQAIAQALPRRASGMVFVDIPRAARLAFEPYSVLFANRLKNAGISIDTTKLPTSEEISALLGPAAVWSTTGEKSMEFDYIGPLPLAALLLGGAAAADLQ